jgi:hypothetical protein
MSGITRRSILSGAAVAPAFAQSAQPSDARDRNAPTERKLLSSRYTPESLQKVLVPRAKWHPYPTAEDRDAWTSLPASIGQDLISAAAARLGASYTPLPATLFLEYSRNGNRSRFESARSSRRRQLVEAVLAECAEGKGRFIDTIADGIWITCEETYWGVPAHLGLQKRGTGLPDVSEPTIDLFAAETGAMLAWVDYLLGPRIDKVHPLIRERLHAELEKRILAVYRDRSDFWWMGLDLKTANRPMNNWNPWINSNCLACVLLADADQARRARTVHKILRSLDRFLDSYHDDGGCDEGPGYWSRAGGSLFDNLVLLHSASDGAINFYSVPLVGEMGRFIYRAHIAGPWFVNFADASAKIRPDGELVYRYGEAIGDADMRAFGAWAAKQSSGTRGDSLGRILPALIHAAQIQKAEARPPLTGDVWLPGIGVAFARQRAGSTSGFYFAAQGGHNAESHNHNDVGNFIVFLDGEPLLIDAGVETYSAKTFSSRRYEIWTMQSAYHNLPTVNGIQQSAGRRFAARDTRFRSDDAFAEFSADIAAAYPAEAGIARWRRIIRLDRRAGAVDITDGFALQRAGGKVEMSLMTPREVTRDGGALVLSGVARIRIEGPATPAVKVEEISTMDARLKPVWGDRIYRVLLGWTDLPATADLRCRITRS